MRILQSANLDDDLSFCRQNVYYIIRLYEVNMHLVIKRSKRTIFHPTISHHTILNIAKLTKKNQRNNFVN